MSTPTPPVAEPDVMGPVARRGSPTESLMVLGIFVAFAGLTVGPTLLGLVATKNLGWFSMTGSVGMLLCLLGLVGCRIAAAAHRMQGTSHADR